MAESIHEAPHRVRNFTYLFFILFVIWLALTSSFHWQEVSVGVFLSLVLALMLNRRYVDLGLPTLSLKKIGYSVVYVAVLFKEIIAANFDVAYRVLHPKMPIKPGIVVIKTGLKQDIAKLILANSITLTPGTFTLDIQDDRLLIHWINVQATQDDEATKLIGQRFEKYLKVIFA